MSDWPAREDRWGNQTVLISHAHALSLGPITRQIVGSASPALTAWPAANRAIMIPFRLPRIMVAQQMIVGCGATGGNNFDVGIYDLAGNKIVSSGATARTATSEVIANITDTQIGPGVYYLALASDSTATFIATAPVQVALVKALGIRQASTAYTLPATVTFETAASAYIPVFGAVFIAT